MAWVAVGGAVASAAIGYGANKLLAPKGKAGTSASTTAMLGPTALPGTAGLTSFTPPGFNAGGLNASVGPNGYNVTADANRLGQVGGLANTFGQQADQIGGLRATVAPGFSNIRTAALGQIENARSNSIGNLRENLQRRRVLGSSFAQDAASRTEAEFAQQKAVTEAQTYLQEMETTLQLTQAEFTARRGVFQTGLDEMNLEANLAAGLTGKATDVLGKNAQMEAMLNAQTSQFNASMSSQTSQFNATMNAKSQEAQGKFFDKTFGPVADAVGKGTGKFLAGGGGQTALNLMPTSL